MNTKHCRGVQCRECQRLLDGHLGVVSCWGLSPSRQDTSSAIRFMAVAQLMRNKHPAYTTQVDAVRNWLQPAEAAGLLGCRRARERLANRSHPCKCCHTRAARAGGSDFHAAHSKNVSFETATTPAIARQENEQGRCSEGADRTANALSSPRTGRGVFL